MFYRLESPDASRFWAEDDPDHPNTEFFDCPLNPDHRWHKRRRDLSFVLPSPRNMRDFVWTWHSECLIPQHVIDIFREARLTGFETTPVRVRHADPSIVPPPMWQLRIIGWGGIAAKETGVELLEKCDVCRGLLYKSLNRGASLCPPPDWDGSELFIVWPYGAIFATERVAEVIKVNKLRGMQLSNPATMSMSPVLPRKMGSLGLSEYFPEPRARQIGEPLGIWWPPRISIVNIE